MQQYIFSSEKLVMTHKNMFMWNDLNVDDYQT